jgi:hypothetical protein
LKKDHPKKQEAPDPVVPINHSEPKSPKINEAEEDEEEN